MKNKNRFMSLPLLLMGISLFFAITSCNSGGNSDEDSSNGDSSNGDTFTDPRDGKVYKTVKIGDQIWMAENLNYAIGNSWCYNKNPPICSRYGRLYDWQTARQACPAGWRLPSDTDWTQLTNFLGSNPGAKLKSNSGWRDGGNGTDNYGFTALPGGYLSTNGSFGSIGYDGYWWSATEYDPYYAWFQRLYYSYSDVFSLFIDKDLGFSVRCLRD